LDIGLRVIVDGQSVEVGGDFNYTHNVCPMWRKAGCYDALYMSHGKTAGEILPDLQRAIGEMRKDPVGYAALNPPNGWGDSLTAFEFLCRFTADCVRFPSAVVWVDK
jgi:hypothetical protein